ncbi:hypothetical protein D3C71_1842710 [compost metagenome]
MCSRYDSMKTCDLYSAIRSSLDSDSRSITCLSMLSWRKFSHAVEICRQNMAASFSATMTWLMANIATCNALTAISALAPTTCVAANCPTIPPIFISRSLRS